MDPIIRAADIASVRRLARPGAAAAAAPASAPAALKPVPAVAAVRPAVPGADEWQAVEERTLALAQGEESLRLRLAELARQEQACLARLAAVEQREQALEADLEERRAAAEKCGEQAGASKVQAAVDALRQEARARADTLDGQLQQVMAAMAAARASLLEDADDLLVEIVHGALCRMLGESGAARALVAATVAAVLREVRDGEPVRVYVHPQDLDILQGFAAAEEHRRVQLLPDAGVVLGGCLVETARGTLDARLELQLQSLREGLLAVRAARRSIEVAD